MVALFSIDFGTGSKHQPLTQPHEANCQDTSVGRGERPRAPALQRRLGSPLQASETLFIQIPQNHLNSTQMGKRTLSLFVAVWKGCLARSVENLVEINGCSDFSHLVFSVGRFPRASGAQTDGRQAKQRLRPAALLSSYLLPTLFSLVVRKGDG